MIAGTLKGIISQRLVRTADGHGRVATCEILVMTGRVHDAILDPALTGHMHEVIKEGEFYGMQSFDQHLLKHLQAGRITYEEAMKVASTPHDFKLLVQADQRLQHLTLDQARSPEAPGRPGARRGRRRRRAAAARTPSRAPAAPAAAGRTGSAPAAPAPPAGGSAPPPGF